MSDFVNGFWSVYVALITLVSVVGCGVLLWTQSRARTNAAGETDTTGHVWDETLQEYNHPLPRWWSWLFYITVVFALVYLAVYPGLGSYEGAFKWSSRGQYEGEMQQAEAQYAPIFARSSRGRTSRRWRPTAEAKQDGSSACIVTYCAQCHGSDARGARGFPEP
jgi:cytochrome c oxidase cbb3-type subunit 3